MLRIISLSSESPDDIQKALLSIKIAEDKYTVWGSIVDVSGTTAVIVTDNSDPLPELPNSVVIKEV